MAGKRFRSGKISRRKLARKRRGRRLGMAPRDRRRKNAKNQTTR